MSPRKALGQHIPLAGMGIRGKHFVLTNKCTWSFPVSDWILIFSLSIALLLWITTIPGPKEVMLTLQSCLQFLVAHSGLTRRQRALGQSWWKGRIRKMLHWTLTILRTNPVINARCPPRGIQMSAQVQKNYMLESIIPLYSKNSLGVCNYRY